MRLPAVVGGPQRWRRALHWPVIEGCFRLRGVASESSPPRLRTGGRTAAGSYLLTQILFTPRVGLVRTILADPEAGFRVEDMAASQVKKDFQDAYLGARDLDLSRTLNPGIKTFDDWLETWGDQLPPGS